MLTAIIAVSIPEMTLVQRAGAPRSFRRLSALSARGVFAQHQTPCKICLKWITEPRRGNWNMTSTWLLVYKDTWECGEHYGVCVRPQRTASEAEFGAEVEGVGVMGLPLLADTMNAAGLKHSFCLTWVHELIVSWNCFFFFFFSPNEFNWFLN